jgi:hypothetical protein
LWYNIDRKRGKNMEVNDYLVTKDREDLLSSLKGINKKVINKKLMELDLENLQELKKYILEHLKDSIKNIKDRWLLNIHFETLLTNENKTLSVDPSDVENFIVFLYEEDGEIKYYMPTEVKDIIKRSIKVK